MSNWSKAQSNTPAQRVAYIGIKGLPSKAGADRVVEAIVRRIDKTQYQPVVYCSAAVVPAGTQLPGIDLVRIPVWGGKHLHALSLFVFSALHALLLGNYTFVHVHNVEACFVLPLLRLRYPVITTSHGAAQKRDKWSKTARLLIQLTEYPFIHFANRITSVSAPLTDYYTETYHKPVTYIPNGVDEDDVIDAEAAQALLTSHGIPANFLLFAAGRIIPTKGCEYLLEAFRELDDECHLVVVGDTTQVPAYEKLLYTLANERVHFIPFVSEKSTVLGLIRLSRLFIFPSTVEAMSMMLLETAVTKTPIICSDIPENVSVLPEQALFFASASSADLKEKLAWALAHPAEMDALAHAAWQRVITCFQWEKIVTQYEHLYGALVASPKNRNVVVTSSHSH